MRYPTYDKFCDSHVHPVKGLHIQWCRVLVPMTTARKAMRLAGLSERWCRVLRVGEEIRFSSINRCQQYNGFSPSRKARLGKPVTRASVYGRKLPTVSKSSAGLLSPGLPALSQQASRHYASVGTRGADYNSIINPPPLDSGV